jgi:hypothetical protein
LQQELESAEEEDSLSFSRAEDKQKMLTILEEAINPELQLVGKIKTAIQTRLGSWTGRLSRKY